MSISERVLSLVDAVYEAGREPHGWRSAVEQFLRVVGATGGGLQLHDAKSWQPLFCEQVGLSRESIDDYVERFMHHNPVVKASVAKPVGVPVLDWMAVPKRDLVRTPIYQEWARRNGVHSSANIVLSREHGRFANFNLIRSLALDEFSLDDLKLLNAVAPHLMRAVDMNRSLEKLNRERYAAYAVLERIEAGVLLVGAGGYVVHMNGTAADVLATKDGIVLVHNRISPQSSDARRELARLIHDAASHSGCRGGTLAVARQSGRRPFSVRVYPLSVRGRFVPPNGASAIVFVTDPEWKPQYPATAVALAYGLTAAETRLLTQLLESPTLLAAADALRIAESTARTHLTRILAKTGTSRQTELFRLVHRTKPPQRPQ